MLFVMRGHVVADRQLCFTNRPSGNKLNANHSPNESISPGLIQLENKCLHLTQHGGPSTVRMQLLNTQTAAQLSFSTIENCLFSMSVRKVKQQGYPSSYRKSTLIVSHKVDFTTYWKQHMKPYKHNPGGSLSYLNHVVFGFFAKPLAATTSFIYINGVMCHFFEMASINTFVYLCDLCMIGTSYLSSVC